MSPPLLSERKKLSDLFKDKLVPMFGGEVDITCDPYWLIYGEAYVFQSKRFNNTSLNVFVRNRVLNMYGDRGENFPVLACTFHRTTQLDPNDFSGRYKDINKAIGCNPLTGDYSCLISDRSTAEAIIAKWQSHLQTALSTLIN